MSGFTFKMRATPGQRLDLSALNPVLLADMSEAEITKLPIGTTKQPVTVGDAFEFTPGDVTDITFEGLTGRCDRVGYGLSGGRITVSGEVGARCGARMTGGAIVIQGAAGPYAGASMAGGTLEIGGDAGSHLGAPALGDTQGQKGGLIIVRGDAGDYAGDRMRRGTILICGSAGDFLASRLIAGTIVAAKGAGRWPGYAMRRGTLYFGAEPASMLPTFADCGTLDLGILRLLKREIAEAGVAEITVNTRVHRFAGDMAARGKGEILLAV